ncbi:MAG: formate dehydrogenase subunit alpha [Magnetococcales bacterium]|nr:formate dehydrogenase subunit alpha [Magnetococcales bacterium]
MDALPFPTSERAMIHAILDGQPVEVAPGTTILQAVRGLGGDLPTLCHSPLLPPGGNCRLCLVEREGGALVPACATALLEGDRLITRSPRLTEIRRGILALQLHRHPLACLGCPVEGRCQLQRVAVELGFTPFARDRAPLPPPDASHPFLHRQPELCIDCGRCVRACAHIQGQDVLGLAGRGDRQRVIAGADQELSPAGCVACGQCLSQCPTGALREPSPLAGIVAEQTVITTCGYCAVGCQLRVETAGGRVLRIEPDPAGSANRGHACVKGRFGHGFVHHPERLTTPLIRQPTGDFREASWAEALALVARRLGAIRDRDGPGALGVVSSARCTNEENFLLQKFARVVLGTNNVDNCARVCHSPSAFALGEALGTGAGTSSFEDVERSTLLMIVGANPTEAHPVLGARIRQAARRGTPLIVLDPRRTELARLAAIHLPVRPGFNVAVINALQWVVLEEGLMEADFVAAHAEGLEAVRQAVAGCTPEWAAPLAGVEAAAIRQAARLYARSPASQILWGLGITESCYGTRAAFGLINLAVLTGQVGRPGSGCSPIRGQNNVQGACDMGALPNVFSDYRPVSDETARREHQEAWGVLPPARPGLKIPDMLAAAREGALKGMYLVAQDLAQSDPDTHKVHQALANLEFLVVQEIFMSESAKLAHVVLPGASFLEKSGTFVNSDRRVQRVRPAVSSPGAALADGEIVHRLARAMGRDLGAAATPDGPMDPVRVMGEIARLSPNWRGISYDRLEASGFLQWPCPAPDHPGTTLVHAGGEFIRGRARLTPTPWHPPAEEPDADYPFLLTTGRILFHYNVGTMTRRTAIAQLAGAGEERLRLHPADAAALGVIEGARLRLSSRRGTVHVTAGLSDDLPRGMLFMAFHHPKTRTNLLVGDASDEYTRCPEYKVTAVRLEKVHTSDL